MTWAWWARLLAWWRTPVRRVTKRPRPWPADRPQRRGPAPFAPRNAERVRDLAAQDTETDERIEVFDWRVREFARQRGLERERYRRERRS